MSLYLPHMSVFLPAKAAYAKLVAGCVNPLYLDPQKQHNAQEVLDVACKLGAILRDADSRLRELRTLREFLEYVRRASERSCKLLLETTPPFRRCWRANWTSIVKQRRSALDNLQIHQRNHLRELCMKTFDCCTHQAQLNKEYHELRREVDRYHYDFPLGLGVDINKLVRIAHDRIEKRITNLYAQNCGEWAAEDFQKWKIRTQARFAAAEDLRRMDKVLRSQREALRKLVAEYPTQTYLRPAGENWLSQQRDSVSLALMRASRFDGRPWGSSRSSSASSSSSSVGSRYLT